MGSLLDGLAPTFDAVARYEIEVRAPRERVYAALRTTDFAGSGVTRVLLRLRALGTRREPRALTLDQVVRGGFVLLEERPDEELVFGVAGRFWTPSGDIQTLDRDAFLSFERAGFAKGYWNFSVAPTVEGRTTLATETRVRCLDESSRRGFRRYWRLVRPFSGLIRREMLRLVKETAERP